MHEKPLTPNLQCGTDPNMIRPWSEHDPTTHETVSHPSHSRGRSSTFGDALCMEKHRLSCICYLSKTFKNAFRARLPRKLHRQLLHQHHLQSHLQWGNDPRVANHNGIPSATHPPAPLATPFTMRERSYSCKSQWNSVDHTCTKNSWHPIYNAEPIRTWSAHDPTTHETVSHPSHSRGRSSTFVDALCMEKHRLSCICYLSKTFKNAFRARLPRKLHRQLLHQHHLQSHLQWGNDPRVANHNGIPSATHPPAPLATPFTMRERSYSCKSQWNSVDHTCTKNSWHPIYNAEPIRPYPPMIRTWSDHTRDRLAPVAQQR